MRMAEWIDVALIVASPLLVLTHRIKMRRERLRPTLRHWLFASHLTSVLHRPRCPRA
jgi:hypothetical protein